MRVPPSQSLTRCGGGRQRLLAALEPQRAGDAGQPGAEGEDLDVAAPRAIKRMRELHVVVGAGLHRAGDVDQQQDLARPRRGASAVRAAAPRRRCARSRAGCGADRRTGRDGRACGDGRAAAAGGQAASRDSWRSASPVALGREAAFDQRLRARGGQPGFVGLVGQQRFVLAASFLLQANRPPRLRAPA